MKINYRLADVKDIDEITEIISLAVKEMEKDNIYQWDEVYPTRTDFLGDIEKKYLYVGLIDEKISVVYTINMEYDVQYKNGYKEVGVANWRKGNFYLMEKYL